MNDLDRQLQHELNPFDFNEKRIRELVLVGANINAIDDGGKPIAFKAIEPEYDEKEIDHRGDMVKTRIAETMLIELLLELGLNVDIADTDNYTILWQAYMSVSPKITEVLLKAGASPNIVDPEEMDTIYSDAVCWADYMQSEISRDSPSESFNNEVTDLKEIVRLMEQYGGDYSWKIYTNKIEKFIRITSTDWCETGLLTWRGMIRIKDISGIDSTLINEFNNGIALCRTTTKEERNSIQKDLAQKFGKIIDPKIKIYTDEQNFLITSRS